MKRRLFVQGLAAGAGVILARPRLSLAASRAVADPSSTGLPPAAGPTLLPTGQVLAPGIAPAAADADAPLWLFAPVEVDGAVAAGWSLAAVSPVAYGGFYIDLVSDEGTARISVSRLDEGAAMGIAHTARLDLLLANAGHGCAATQESVAQAIVALAALATANEGGRVDTLPLMTYRERVASFGPGVLL